MRLDLIVYILYKLLLNLTAVIVWLSSFCYLIPCMFLLNNFLVVTLFLLLYVIRPNRYGLIYTQVYICSLLQSLLNTKIDEVFPWMIDKALHM